MPSDAAHVSLRQIEAMRSGARVAVQTCMNVMPGNRVFVLTDQATHGIGRLLGEEASAAGGEVLVHDLEQYAERPILVMPDELRSELSRFKPHVTFYAASSQPGEVAFRMALRTFLTHDLKARHAHMPGITVQAMTEGMNTDYQRVASITRAVYDVVRLAQTIHVTTPDGTDLTARFNPDWRWVPCTGLYHQPGQWGNLPEGETFSCPETVEGRVVAHVIGDFFSQKYGMLKDPITFTIHDGLVTEIKGRHQALVAELLAYLDGAENGRRVGEFAIGTNIGLHRLTGNLLQDEKIPGVHVAFGNPYPAETKAPWSSPVHVDVIPVRCTITVDGEEIMRDGRFDYDYLGVALPRGFGG
ncbi:MAG: aminopeptidase [Anaerolineae bacterium]